ncbi:MAG: hypothetical protein GWP10_03365 [Nitrospiraceae bacterium]|nr:hypothetical protein [Nitrospiraceae bacterium]
MHWQAFFRKNWVLKLISLAFALLLWFFVVGEEKAEVSISIPLELVNIPSGLVIANDIPSAINIRVYGPRSMIRALAVQGVLKVIDLRDTAPGNIMVHITPNSLPLPAGVRAMRIEPSNIEIVLEPLLRSNLLIRPVFTGSVVRGYKILKVDVQPSRVVLAGPEKEIKSLKEIKTLPIDLSGASDTIVREVGLDLQALHIVPGDIESIKVTVYIIPIQGTRRITHIPVILKETRAHVSWWPKIVSVRLHGPTIKLKAIKTTDIKARISIKGLQRGTHWVTPECTIPTGFTLLKVIPKKIRVTINK